jgi:exosortase/archaeosortase family protein
VTTASSARQSPAERTYWPEHIGRAAIFAGAGVIATVNALADQIIASDGSLIIHIVDLGGISAVIWFAMYAALKIGLQGEGEPLRKADVPVLLAILASCFIPVTVAARAGVLLCALYFFATTRSDAPDRRVALVLLALTGTLVWGPLILTLLAAPILSLDAHITGWIIGSPVTANMVQFAGTDRIYIVAIACSSIHNISLAIVLWCTAVALFDLKVDRRLLLICAGMIALMFALNIVRLSLMGLFPDRFDFLHAGAGGLLFGWLEVIAMALLAGLGVSNAVARPR